MGKNKEGFKSELGACQLPEEFVSFLLKLLKAEPLKAKDLDTFIQQKPLPNVSANKKHEQYKKHTEEIESSILDIEYGGKTLHALKPIALAALAVPSADPFYTKLTPNKLTIKQLSTGAECEFHDATQTKLTPDEITIKQPPTDDDEYERNKPTLEAFNNFCKKIFPNIEMPTNKLSSSITILLPKSQATQGVSNWDLYNITDEIFSSPTSNEHTQNRSFRLAILLILLKQIRTKNKRSDKDNLTPELIERLSLPIKNVDDTFFALDDELTKKIVGEKDAKQNTLLNLMLRRDYRCSMDTFKVATVLRTRTNTSGKDLTAKDLAEFNRAEQGACWGLGYFLASFDGVAINIKLKRFDKYPMRNIIIAPKVMCDTLRQIQPYRSNYLTGSIEYIKDSDTFLHHKPYHSNKTPRIGKEPSSLQEPKTSIAKLLLGGAGSRSLEPHEYVLEETGIPGETKQVPLNKEPLETQELIHFPIYLPPFLRAQTFEDFVSKSPQRR